ncbi:4-hydroxythreonine-4-phosphate dehydrogenase PdxA [Bdellovibrio sp. HCB337]|uniref:4-hydroxythreonine-4-phosphate dehydrogenase PdxA n=1 Tax=Bdellovibrio sp. HCB337 TaxID=3394358 RepID=UPI0039A5208A
MLKIAITSGDSDGIGLEIAEKALLKMGPQKGAHFLIWRSASSFPRNLKKLDKKFKLVSFASPLKALNYLLSAEMKANQLVEIVSEESPALWVQQTAVWCQQKQLHGMVTGPLSKTEIYRAGLQDMGHTDILKRISRSQKVHMGFLGNKFNVVLNTAHIPLSKVSTSMNVVDLLSGIEAANALRKMLPVAQQKKPIGVLGLNPHAGEEGLIGIEEREFVTKALNEAAKAKIPVLGPLVPDAAFLEENWKKYSVYLALYHDQGLIPFKAIHGQKSGVHVSLGIPFVRTSVDHGTAKDIFGKNKAIANSMIDAIQACLRLAKSSIK